MAGPVRVTGPFLDVVEVLWRAYLVGADDLHGWAILRATKRPGPTVYGILDRLEDMSWITGRWESEHPELGKPRRRLYRLTPNGGTGAQHLLAERRPDVLVQHSHGGGMPVWPSQPREAGAT